MFVWTYAFSLWVSPCRSECGLAAENVEKFPWEDVRRPLAATRVAASGCKWPPETRDCWRPLAATCGHLRPLEWLQVAAIAKIKLHAPCVLNVIIYIYIIIHPPLNPMNLPWNPYDPRSPHHKKRVSMAMSRFTSSTLDANDSRYCKKLTWWPLRRPWEFFLCGFEW